MPEIEYRPCLVKIKKETETRRTIHGEIETRVVREEEEHRAIFHKWAERYWTIGPSALIGGYSAGQMSQTLAIVEYEDGSVHEHYPNEIFFLDKKIKEYADTQRTP